MKRVKLTVGICLVFILGALAGMLGTGVYMKYRFEKFGPGPPPPHARERIMKRLTETLDLTEKQQGEIREIVDLTQSRMDAVRERHLPEIKKITEQSFELMKEKLDPEQIEKLDELRAKIKSEIKKRERKKHNPSRP